MSKTEELSGVFDVMDSSGKGFISAEDLVKVNRKIRIVMVRKILIKMVRMILIRMGRMILIRMVRMVLMTSVMLTESV